MTNLSQVDLNDLSAADKNKHRQTLLSQGIAGLDSHKLSEANSDGPKTTETSR